MSFPIDQKLHDEFKAATATQGRKMTEVLVEFIQEYVLKYGSSSQQKKGGR